jgi:hypothetical protein
MARNQLQLPPAVQLPAAILAKRGGTRSVSADDATPDPKRDAGNVKRWPRPMPPGVGSENLALIYAATQRTREPIAALKPDLPEVSTALGAASSAILSACVGALTALSDFQEVSTKEEAAVQEQANLMAESLEAVDPTMGYTTKEAVSERAKKFRGVLYDKWIKRYEAGKEKLSLKVGSEVVTKLEAGADAIERVELRAGLDLAPPDPALVAAVQRSVMAEPSLQRPRKAKELLDKAMRLNDAALLLALESVIPEMQSIIEGGVSPLTRNATMRAGQPTDCYQAAAAVVSMLRALRDQRLAQPAIATAREILSALEWLALKIVGVDAADPASVKNWNGRSGGKLMADGTRWPTRYIKSTAALKWPPLLTPMPMANMTSEPAVIRAAAPAVLPVRVGEPNPVRVGTPSAARRASGRK